MNNTNASAHRRERLGGILNYYHRGAAQEMYDSFDRAEMPTYQLDSLSMNPPPNVAARIDGAMSGITRL